MAYKPTIEKVYDLFRDRPFTSEEILKKDAEIGTYRVSKEKRFICLACGNPVRIKGSSPIREKGKQKVHFAHYKGAECSLMTDESLTQEDYDRMNYNLKKESPEHIALKDNIYSLLSKTPHVENMKMECIMKGEYKKWRKPDINFEYKGFKVAFDIQHSATWISTILARNEFYFNNKIYLIWVVDDFSTDFNERRLFTSDIFNSKNYNILVFDRDAKEYSLGKGQLYFKCYYSVFKFDKAIDEIKASWPEMNLYVKLEDLTFDTEKYEVYYNDSVSTYKSAESNRTKFYKEQKIREERGTLRKLMKNYFYLSSYNTTNEVESMSIANKQLLSRFISIKILNSDIIDILTCRDILNWKEPLALKSFVIKRCNQIIADKVVADILTIKEKCYVGDNLWNWEYNTNIKEQLDSISPEVKSIIAIKLERYYPVLREMPLKNLVKLASLAKQTASGLFSNVFNDFLCQQVILDTELTRKREEAKEESKRNHSVFLDLCKKTDQSKAHLTEIEKELLKLIKTKDDIQKFLDLDKLKYIGFIVKSEMHRFPIKIELDSEKISFLAKKMNRKGELVDKINRINLFLEDISRLNNRLLGDNTYFEINESKYCHSICEKYTSYVRYYEIKEYSGLFSKLEESSLSFYNGHAPNRKEYIYLLKIEPLKAELEEEINKKKIEIEYCFKAISEAIDNIVLSIQEEINRINVDIDRVNDQIGSLKSEVKRQKNGLQEYKEWYKCTSTVCEKCFYFLDKYDFDGCLEYVCNY